MSCTDNFDEIRDTDQRYIEFVINNGECLNNVLLPSTDSFTLGSSIPANARLHISAYCYDTSYKLISSKIFFDNLNSIDTITFRHLDKNNEYVFVIVADIVQYMSSLDYQVTWFQIEPQYATSFYVARFENAQEPVCNLLFKKVIVAKPTNNSVPIEIENIVNTGYIRFCHADDVDKISGDSRVTNEFHPFNDYVISSRTFTFSCNNTENSTDILVPVFATIFDNTIYVKVKTTHDLQQDSAILYIPNYQHRPFVADVNCSTLELDNVNYY